MPSEEMLKTLLDEFIEKEALIQEELVLVHDQIRHLSERMELCRTRMSTIEGDRQRVLTMKDRYENYQPSKSKQYSANIAPDRAALSLSAKSKPENGRTDNAISADSSPRADKSSPTEQPADAAKSAQDAAKSAQDAAKSAQDAAKPAQDAAKPAQDAAKPAQDAAKPAQDAAKPAQDAAKSAPVASGEFPAVASKPSTVVDGLITTDSTPDVAAAFGGASPWDSPAAESKESTEQSSPEPQPQKPAADPAEAKKADDVVDLGGEDNKPEPKDNDTVKSINDALRSLFR